MSIALTTEVLLNRCVKRVRREFSKKTGGVPLSTEWLEGYRTAIMDLIWDLYSRDKVLKEKDWDRGAKELRDDRLQTVTSKDYY
jgi:hypothetical protein